MQRHFDDELRELREELVYMGSLVEDMFQKAVKSMLERNEALAQEVIDSDDRIDQLEVKIEDLAIHITVLRQPAASDLRRVVTALHINRQLERMGDKAVDIAQRSIKLLRYPPVRRYVNLPEATEIVRSMIRDTLEAYLNQNAELARQVIARDDRVDELRDQVFDELSTCMVQDSESIHPCMEVILVFRHLERIGDLAADICEDTIYMVEGEIIKHQFNR
jgi:phosphate transport system protein